MFLHFMLGTKFMARAWFFCFLTLFSPTTILFRMHQKAIGNRRRLFFGRKKKVYGFRCMHIATKRMRINYVRNLDVFYGFVGNLFFHVLLNLDVALFCLMPNPSERAHAFNKSNLIHTCWVYRVDGHEFRSSFNLITNSLICFLSTQRTNISPVFRHRVTATSNARCYQ